LAIKISVNPDDDKFWMPIDGSKLTVSLKEPVIKILPELSSAIERELSLPIPPICFAQI
jgi:hypothetical protein